MVEDVIIPGRKIGLSGCGRRPICSADRGIPYPRKSFRVHDHRIASNDFQNGPERRIRGNRSGWTGRTLKAECRIGEFEAFVRMRRRPFGRKRRPPTDKAHTNNIGHEAQKKENSRDDEHPPRRRVGTRGESREAV
jgi:hypothetical protein